MLFFPKCNALPHTIKPYHDYAESCEKLQLLNTATVVLQQQAPTQAHHHPQNIGTNSDANVPT